MYEGTTIKCEDCGNEVWLGSGWSYECSSCGTQYNAFGQRLRDDWASNPSCWSDVDDLEGFELSQLAAERYED